MVDHVHIAISDHITHILPKLPWLPVRQHIHFKILLITYKSISFMDVWIVVLSSSAMIYIYVSQTYIIYTYTHTYRQTGRYNPAILLIL